MREIKQVKALTLTYKIGGGRKCWVTVSKRVFRLSNGDVITIKPGFEWDLSSVPRFLWWLFPPFGDFILGALVHDWMYFNDYKIEELGAREARKFADKQMLFISRQYNNRNVWCRLDNNIRYIAVRLFGGIVYRK